jgi:hypothetical protein
MQIPQYDRTNGSRIIIEEFSLRRFQNSFRTFKIKNSERSGVQNLLSERLYHNIKSGLNMCNRVGVFKQHTLALLYRYIGMGRISIPRPCLGMQYVEFLNRYAYPFLQNNAYFCHQNYMFSSERR